MIIALSFSLKTSKLEAIHTHISSVFEIKMAVDNVLDIVID